MSRIVLAGALGNCVHVAGVVQFLRLAEDLGYETQFLGPAVPVEDFINAIHEYKPDIVGISYRLTPEVSKSLLKEFKDRLTEEDIKKVRFVFGGTPPVCKAAETVDLFERCFNGLENMSEVMQYLSGTDNSINAQTYRDDLIQRIEASYPLPLIRHHFGLPDMKSTILGVKEISKASVVDIISLAPDQNAQECFFRPSEMDPNLDGAGGAPIREKEDLLEIKKGSLHGNHPLLRVYSGTRDLISWAELSKSTLNNAWGAVPLCWYSVLDGRSKRQLEEAISENQQAMKWYADHNIPLEVNESHHWSLRDAHDTVAVVMAYLAAYNAKKAGIKYYISQYMFNTPPTTSPVMDIAKMLAKIELIEALHDDRFTTYRQVRAGLLHLSPKLNVAKGQLAVSTAFALQLKPHIIHVVGYCEGDHAANPQDVIESCEIVQGVIKNCLKGQPNYIFDEAILARKRELLSEANTLLKVISNINEDQTDPFVSPQNLSKAIKLGILDAPHLKGNPHAHGKLDTQCVDGAIYAWDKKEHRIISEAERLSSFL